MIHQVQRMGMSRLLMVFGNALCCPVVAIVVDGASAFSGSDDVDFLAGQGLYSQSSILKSSIENKVSKSLMMRRVLSGERVSSRFGRSRGLDGSFCTNSCRNPHRTSTANRLPHGADRSFGYDECCYQKHGGRNGSSEDKIDVAMRSKESLMEDADTHLTGVPIGLTVKHFDW